MEKICYIIGAGDVDICGYTAGKEDKVICADAGYSYRAALGRDCDLAVGDFDSLGKTPDIENIIVAPCEKDETDMLLAINQGIAMGYSCFVIFGALGGERYDHSLGNLQLLHYLCQKGCQGFIVTGDRIFTAFKSSACTLSPSLRGYASVFSLTDKSEGVTIRNMKYTLENSTLMSSNPVGISNEFTGQEAFIKVEKGVLALYYKGKVKDFRKA